MEFWIFIILTIILSALLGTTISYENIDPRNALVLKNLFGQLSVRGPGFQIFSHIWQSIFLPVNCQDVILAPPALTVQTRDVQPVKIKYQLTLRVDGFDERGRLKKENIMRAASRIGEQKTEGAKGETKEKRFNANKEEVMLKESNVAIQNMIGDILLEELITQKEKKPSEGEYVEITCPSCGAKIKGTFCPTETCPKHQQKRPDGMSQEEYEKIKEKVVPIEFFQRLSWSAGIKLHEDLNKRYGLGCYLRIANVDSPEDIEEAIRTTKIAELRGEAIKKRLQKEAEAFQNFKDRTGINPNIAFFVDKLSQSLEKRIGGKTTEEKPKKGDKK